SGLSEDPSSDHIPPLPATSSFLSSNNDTTDSDSPDTPPSPTHAPRQPIPHGRPYRYHLNGPIHMMTARKRVRPLPTHRLASFNSVRADLIPSLEIRKLVIRQKIQAEIDECFAYADTLRDREIDARVVVEAVDREESETGARGLVKVRVERVTHTVMPEDIPEPAQEGAGEVTYETLGDLVQRKMPNTRSGASMTHEEVKELVNRRVAEEMEAREAARTLEPLNKMGMNKKEERTKWK
ncbi:hypothetical protein Tco_0828493, partial [Tanacetum coccineum]